MIAAMIAARATARSCCASRGTTRSVEQPADARDGVTQPDMRGVAAVQRVLDLNDVVNQTKFNYGICRACALCRDV